MSTFGGRDDAHVRTQCFGPAEPLELAKRSTRKSFACVVGAIADLVQEERSALGQLENGLFSGRGRQ